MLGVSEVTTYLPLFDVVPQILEFLETQLACRVTIHHSHHAATCVNAKTISLQVRVSGHDLVENVHEFCGTDLHVLQGEVRGGSGVTERGLGMS